MDCLNVLITGGEGYIGRALTTYLKLHVNKVVSYDIELGHDILDTNKLTNFLIDNNIHVVIHLAAISSVTGCYENPTLAMLVNNFGTDSVLQAMKKSGCKNIIYASTSSVYGNSDSVLSTQYPTCPHSIYGESKLLGEQCILDYYNINSGNYLIFRMFNVVGVLGNNTNKSNGYDRLFGALESNNITIYGTNYNTKDGTCERDYISLEDVCHAYLLGLKVIITKNTKNTLNICNGISTSVLEVVQKWQTLSPNPLKISYGNRRVGDPERVCGDNIETINLLNWHPKNNIENIIQGIINTRNI